MRESTGASIPFVLVWRAGYEVFDRLQAVLERRPARILLRRPERAKVVVTEKGSSGRT